jgi:hypothetical protein
MIGYLPAGRGGMLDSKRNTGMSEKLKTVVVMGTLDTKGPELVYLAEQVRSAASVLCREVKRLKRSAGPLPLISIR